MIMYFMCVTGGNVTDVVGSKPWDMKLESKEM